ncbi:hypothetical protein [Pseudomonas sp. MM211]|nr:hypothetical protein [Pseudomonas sp. MM211]
MKNADPWVGVFLPRILGAPLRVITREVKRAAPMKTPALGRRFQ